MNILYINHPESDYGGAFLHNGLCQLFGGQAVYDLPVKKSYHGQTHDYTLPKKGIKEGHTAPLPWMDGWPCNWDCVETHNHYNEKRKQDEYLADPLVLPDLDDADVLEEAREKIKQGFFHLVVVETCWHTRHVAFDTYKALEKELLAAGIPLVVHDGEDHMQFDDPTVNAMHPSLVLKREFNKQWAHDIQVAGARVVPFPFSFPYKYDFDGSATGVSAVAKSAHSMHKYKFDVTFMCGMTHSDRSAVADAFLESALKCCVAVDGKNASTFTNKVHPLLPWQDYIAQMANSKMAVSVRGFGYDTVRYWEAPFCTVMLSQEPGIVLPNPYSHESTGLSFNTPQQAVDIATKWCDREAKADLNAIRLNGIKHGLKFHTNAQRAKSMLDALDAYKGIRFVVPQERLAVIDNAVAAVCDKKPETGKRKRAGK